MTAGSCHALTPASMSATSPILRCRVTFSTHLRKRAATEAASSPRHGSLRSSLITLSTVSARSSTKIRRIMYRSSGGYFFSSRAARSGGLHLVVGFG